METTETLDFDLGKFSELLLKSNELVLDKFEGMETAKAFAGLNPKQVQAWFDEPIPRKGMDSFDLLDLVKEKVLDTATMNMGPNMYAYVMTGGNQISILAELLATTINQNVGKWHLAPVMSELEKRVVQWGASFMGYGEHAGGAMTSGGSAANLMGLTVARNIYFEKENIRQKGLFGMKPIIVYGSNEVHGCIDKSIELLGIGTDHYRKITTLADFTIDLDALEAQIKQDIADGYQPFCLIGNAGTVNTGAIDPLWKMAQLAKKYDLWFHVDGAYGALAAGTKLVGGLYRGIELADSVAMDFHKWLYQPFEAGCCLVKHWNQLNRTYYKKASYLSTDIRGDGRFDFNEHHFQLSRNAKAFKVWMSFKAYGSDRLIQMIEKDIRLTHYLDEKLRAASDFKVYHEPQLGVLCFQYLGALEGQQEVDQLNRNIIPALERDGRVFITGTSLNGQAVIRACLINHRLQKNNLDYLIKVIREVGQNVLKNEGKTLVAAS